MVPGRDPWQGSCGADFAGERVVLLRSRALWRPGCGDLLVADVHLGKGATLRRAGIGLKAGATQQDLDALVDLAAGVAPKRLIILGDLWHTSTEAGTPAGEAIGAGLRRIRDLGTEVLLVSGNHDRRAGPVDPSWPLEVTASCLQVGAMTYAHEPSDRDGGPWVLAGHVHPSIKIRTGRDRMTLPVFWQRDSTLVLPAFGGFTGTYPVGHLPRRALWVVTPDGVLAWQQPHAQERP